MVTPELIHAKKRYGPDRTEGVCLLDFKTNSGQPERVVSHGNHSDRTVAARPGDGSFRFLPYHTVDGRIGAYHGDNGNGG